MKTCAFLLLTLMLNFSCYNKSGDKGKVIYMGELKNETSVIGTWQICKMLSDGTETAYNVCPTIVFSSGGNGSLSLPETQMSFFQWTVNNNFISFSFKSEKDKNSFITKDTDFNFKIYEKEDLIIFELIHSKSSYRYILSRVKK